MKMKPIPRSRRIYDAFMATFIICSGLAISTEMKLIGFTFVAGGIFFAVIAFSSSEMVDWSDSNVGDPMNDFWERLDKRIWK